MSATHTPGPWALDAFPFLDGYHIRGGGTGRKTARVITVVKNQDTAPVYESQANAHLIAAAPDLLEAANKLISAAESEGWDRHRGTDEQRGGICELRAAIAKATGGAR